MSEVAEEAAGRHEATSKAIQTRLDRLTAGCGLLLFSTALWCLWPVFTSGAPLLSVLAPVAVSLLWAGMLPDLMVSTAQTRSRLGAASSVVWAPIAVIGVFGIPSGGSVTLGAALLLVSSAGLLITSRNLLVGGFSVARYRAVMGGVGAVAALSVLVPRGTEDAGYGMVVVALAIVIAARDWVGSDEQRSSRSAFRRRLDGMETRILQHRAAGSPVDQAASLVLTAAQRGHVDPRAGLDLLDRAEDAMQRALRLEDDIAEIRKDVLAAVEAAEDAAPAAKRPRRTMVEAEREVELGSLEEGEALFRAAKRQALEVSEWWQRAERSITDAKRLLRDGGGASNNALLEMLEQAEEELRGERPRQAHEIAVVIPLQLGVAEDTAAMAGELLETAEKRIAEVDGLDTAEWTETLERAASALGSGENDLARGLCESVLREVEKEREAMDHVRRALRQRSSLAGRWAELSDSDAWDSRLGEVDGAADERKWTHAAELLQRLSDALDADLGAFSEARELVEFATEEWGRLRIGLEQAGIDLLDEQRRDAELKLGEASEASRGGELAACLTALGEFDLACEALRRRI